MKRAKIAICKTPQEVTETCLKIREIYMQRQQIQQAILRLNNQIKAIERRMKEAKFVEKPHPRVPASADSSQEFETGECQARNVTPLIHATSVSIPAATYSLSLVCPMLMMAMDALAPQLKMVEKRFESEAKKLALLEQLPRGMAALSLGKLIGECGELSNYSTPAKLWRRMGMAPYKGRSAEQWRMRGGLSAAEWSEYGYSARRRSLMFTIGTFVMMAKNQEYTALYAARKEYEQSKEPGAKPIVWHKRAKRYMEKRLLLNLWKAWRDATDLESSNPVLHSQPSTIISDAGEAA